MLQAAAPDYCIARYANFYVHPGSYPMMMKTLCFYSPVEISGSAEISGATVIREQLVNMFSSERMIA
jgi:hypothetical protein